MEFNGKQIPDEVAKEIGNFLAQDLSGTANKFTNLLQMVRKHASPEMVQEIDKGLVDLSKVTETVNKIKL